MTLTFKVRIDGDLLEIDGIVTLDRAEAILTKFLAAREMAQQARIDQLAAKLRTQTDALADAVAANDQP